MVASNEQSWWKVHCQNVQPGHVEVTGYRLFTSNGHAPAWDRVKQYFTQLFLTLD